MLLDTSVDGVRLLLLGADDDSRPARRLRAAGAEVRAVAGPAGAAGAGSGAAAEAGETPGDEAAAEQARCGLGSRG